MLAFVVPRRSSATVVEASLRLLRDHSMSYGLNFGTTSYFNREWSRKCIRLQSRALDVDWLLFLWTVHALVVMSLSFSAVPLAFFFPSSFFL